MVPSTQEGGGREGRHPLPPLEVEESRQNLRDPWHGQSTHERQQSQEVPYHQGSEHPKHKGGEREEEIRPHGPEGPIGGIKARLPHPLAIPDKGYRIQGVGHQVGEQDEGMHHPRGREGGRPGGEGVTGVRYVPPPLIHKRDAHPEKEEEKEEGGEEEGAREELGGGHGGGEFDNEEAGDERPGHASET